MPRYRIRYKRSDLEECLDTELVITEALDAETPEGAIVMLMSGGYPQFNHSKFISVERLGTG